MNKHYSYIYLSPKESRSRKLRRFIGNVCLAVGCVLVAWAFLVLALSLAP